MPKYKKSGKITTSTILEARCEGSLLEPNPCNTGLFIKTNSQITIKKYAWQKETNGDNYVKSSQKTQQVIQSTEL